MLVKLNEKDSEAIARSSNGAASERIEWNFTMVRAGLQQT
jgi:hypothetical protein